MNKMKKFLTYLVPILVLLGYIPTCLTVYAYEDWYDSLRRQQERFDRDMEYNQRAHQNQRLYEIQQQMEQQNSYRPTNYSNDSYQRPTYVQEKPLYKFGSSSRL